MKSDNPHTYSPNPIRNVACAYCGKVFMQRLSWQKFCPGGKCTHDFHEAARRRKMEEVRASRLADGERLANASKPEQGNRG